LHGDGQVSSAPEINLPSNGERHDWANCAMQILRFARKMQSAEDVELWRRRDRVFRYLASAR
jgi:hypothetical protein